MIDLAKPIIRQATYLLNFKSIAQKIRFEQAQSEDAFSGLIGAPSQQTNVPDEADPNLARIIFQGGKKQIAISQTGCQFTLSFNDSEFALQEQLRIIKKNITEFYSKSLQFHTEDFYGMTAIILDISFSSKTPSLELQEYLYNKFIQPSRIGDIASIQISLGYKLGDHFLNLSANVYELRKFEVTDKSNHGVRINVEDIPIYDFGLNFKIDINNRPKLMSNPSETAENPVQLFSIVDSFLEEQFENITGLTVF
jgi:hypothetical protein